jgi:hypothetical protein
LRGKVKMTLDAEVDNADPGNTLSRDELEQKALRLAEFSGAASPMEMRRIIDKVWQIANADRVGYLLAGE